MVNIPSVLYPVPKPIGIGEFLDAIRATCPPRFKNARFAKSRRIALAVSGGVDSMALAYLTWRARKEHGIFQVADNPVSRRPRAIVIDHRLRPESTAEAAAVAREVRKFSEGYIQAAPVSISWRKELWSQGKSIDHGEGGSSPAGLASMESLARQARYRLLGRMCRYWGVESLFLAHHQDDQYETVLMRLLAGHGSRGLGGIRPAIEIPECYNVHGVSRSGFVDNQRQRSPYLSFEMGNKALKQLKRQLRTDYVKYEGDSSDDASASVRADLYLDADEGTVPLQGRYAAVEPLEPIDVEDGGVMLYRPLLLFPKARLIATCEANGIKWFDDPTNKDPTLTMRNAIRHMHANFALPPALQKESILQLSGRCVARSQADDAAADKLAERTVIEYFEPNVGTLLVQLPDLSSGGRIRRPSRIFGPSRRTLRATRLRTAAALLTRRLMAFVTPEHHLPVVANLQTVISRLFPALEPDAPPPKTFIHASVIFIPVQSSATPSSPKWLLSRAPHPSTQPLPQVSFGRLSPRPLPSTPTLPIDPSYRARLNRASPSSPTDTMKITTQWRLFDGRFWIRVRFSHYGRFRLAPFLPEYAKDFRDALVDDSQRARLAELLKRYAPGKVRYTLPALYVVTELQALQDVGTERSEPDREKEKWKLLALPTLGIDVADLNNLLQYDVRYKKVDREMLSRCQRKEIGSSYGIWERAKRARRR